MLVLDASVVIAWAYQEEGDHIDALIRHVAANIACVPAHWILEVTNTLLNSERHGKLKTGQRQELLATIQSLPIRVDEETFLRGWQATPALAEQHKLTTYDAAYLELAMRLGVPLATLDQDLARAARAAKIPLFR
jgi:predicted nucleic acid-binding protein